MRNVLTFVLIAALLPATGVAAKKKRPPHCSTTSSAGSLVTTLPLTVHGQRLQLELTTAGTLTGPRTSSLLLSHGRRTLLQSHSSISAGGFTLTIEFGAAAHGIRSIDLASSDGVTVTGSVDGRAIAPFAVGSDPHSVQFADGGKAPKVGIRPVVRQALRKLSRLDLTACTTTGSSAAVSPRPLISNCDLCLYGCAIGFGVCGVGALVEIVGCPLCALASGAQCLKSLFDCSDHCTHGTACCPVPCFGGTGVAISDTAHCDATCSDNTVCCGGSGNPQGECCDHSQNCCGTNCLEGIFAGDRCVNPATGAFCDRSTPGDVCGDTSQSGFAYCCAGGIPVCRDSAQHVCCPQGAGDVCTVNNVTGCCPSDTPHCDGSVCCAAQDVCGNAGACCPPPHTCVGQTCCNSPSTACGSACCDALSTCVDPGNSLCCGGLACGSKCCDGLTQRCVSGDCCPLNSACGTVCCPPGEFCADPNTGTCSPCPQGQVACQVEGGPNICCGPGETCCAGPPAVCCSDPMQQSCCGSPTVQCHTADFCVH